MLALPDGSGEKTMIRKRHMFLNEEILKANPNIAEYMAPSMDVRRDILAVEVPKLAKEAAVKAIEEWGHPKYRITHLVFCTNRQLRLARPRQPACQAPRTQSFHHRFTLSQNGCLVGGTVLRLAKDLAENNRGARVLVVCSEHTAVTFRGAAETHLDNLVGQVLFDVAVIIGADPDPATERPLFQLISASQTLLPDSDSAIEIHLKEVGLIFHLHKDVPKIIAKKIAQNLVEAFEPLGSATGTPSSGSRPRRTRDPRRDGGQAGAWRGRS
ncbi:hypothetical protein C4D60_Mb06t09110 [Musa balbisiana]|uniref:chalcone synthase n=1 Tax=Musa balbisiana TaxID=52838 RepID=A0A4S8IN24_MUSBA|nr:hypothetical protein C4D60_Mb06t09110 [Musa balbisiana]